MPSVVYDVPKNTLEAFALATENNANGLRYWKEVIYTSDPGKPFKRRNPKTGAVQIFDVDAEKISHWVNTGKMMLSNGVEIPLPSGHSEAPESKRGSVVDWDKRVNKKGKDSLWALIEFSNAEYAKQHSANDVSLFADSDFMDGKGNFYVHPPRHVALTDYPVIPGLEKFQAIVASFDTGNETMALRDLATKLGIAADVADDALEAEIETAIDALLAKVDGAKGGDPPPKVEASHSPLVLSLVATNRTTQIESLLGADKITPAEMAEIKAAFCKPEQLKLSLDASGNANDGFAATIALLQKRQPLNIIGKQKTGPQVLALSHAEANDPAKNPTLRNAVKRAEAAKR